MPQDFRSIERDMEHANEEQNPEPVGLLTPKDIAQRLSVSDAMVYKMVREGDLEAVHIGRLVRIRPESYERLLDERSSRAR